MPKPLLKEPNQTKAYQIIETMLAGLHEWRSDLDYPQSHSDMMGCVHALLKMYKVERRPIAIKLEYEER